MNAAPTMQYDMTQLGGKVSQLMGALLGRGASRGDLHNALRVEAGQCAWRIADALGPKTKEAAKQKVETNVQTFFASNEGKYSVFTEEAQSIGYAFPNTTWLTAGPNWLLGIDRHDVLPDISADEALRKYRTDQSQHSRGKAYIEIGRRGKQHIIRLNRRQVSKQTYRGMISVIAQKIGTSRAAFAATAEALLTVKKRIPAWVKDKIPEAIAKGKAITDLNKFFGLSPEITFGSRAPGVESNPWIQKKIQAGMIGTSASLTKKIEKVLNGHTYNWNTGQVFRSTRLEDN